MSPFFAAVLPLVQLFVGSPTPLGDGIDRATVSRVLGAYGVDMQACYDDALKKDPKLRGTVALQLRVDQDGKVLKAASTGGTTLASADAVSCVVAIAAKVRFDEQANPVTVNYSVAFEPPQDDAH